jgi:drug/metabolite transporter (DMT)-like permease
MRSHPVTAALIGALSISMTGVLVRLADQPPATTGIFRCLYALAPLGVIAYVEARREGGMGWRRHGLAFLAGVCFATDLELWHHAILAVGAGLSTVVSNLQIVVVGVVAWAIHGERPEGRVAAAVPLALLGVFLISGVVGADEYGDDPVAGVVYSLLTAVAYSGFLLFIRAANRDLRGAAGPLFWASAWCAAAMTLMGLALDELAWPAAEPQLWLVLLALSAQVVGYLAIAYALPRLPAVVTSILLLAQPCLAVGLAALIVDEQPSWLQLSGVVLVLAGIVVAQALPSPRGSDYGSVTNERGRPR